MPLDIYFGLWNFYASRGQLTRHESSGSSASPSASRQRRRVPALFLGLYTTAAADLFLGHLQSARDGFERLLAIYPKEGLATHALPTTSASSPSRCSATRCGCWGMPTTRRGCRRGDRRGRPFSPFTQSVALVNRMVLATSMRDDDTSRQRAQELIALSSEHFYQYWTVHWRISLALTGISPASPTAEIDARCRRRRRRWRLMRTAYGSNLQCSRFLGWTVRGLPRARARRWRGGSSTRPCC